MPISEHIFCLKFCIFQELLQKSCRVFIIRMKRRQADEKPCIDWQKCYVCQKDLEEILRSPSDSPTDEQARSNCKALAERIVKYYKVRCFTYREFSAVICKMLGIRWANKSTVSSRPIFGEWNRKLGSFYADHNETKFY